MQVTPMDDRLAIPGSTRRQLLSAGASVAGLGLTAFLGGNACAAQPSAAPRRAPGEDDADLLDAALGRIAERFPDVSPHRSNHAPMVSEALSVLGRADAIAPWLDRHLDDFQADRSARRPIEVERWREALGRSERYADWQVLFLAELADGEWTTVLRRWAPRLAPGLAGVATHGVIRTGHAARALSARDNEIRRRELATALAYWAAFYEELPWDGSLAPEPSVEAALARVEPRQPAIAPPRGNIVTGLRALAETASFRPVAGLVDTRDPARTLSEISSAFARLYLRNPAHPIAFTHAVTAPSALRLLVPHLDEETVRAGVGFAWQAAAGIHVVYGDPRNPPAEERPGGEPAAIVALAVENGGSHAIKLAEACLREEVLSRDPLLRWTAEQAARTMNG